MMTEPLPRNEDVIAVGDGAPYAIKSAIPIGTSARASVKLASAISAPVSNAAAAATTTATPSRTPAPSATDSAEGKSDDLRSLPAGEFIFEEGEIGNFAYVVVSGTVDICKLTSDQYVVLKELKKGDLFGEMAIIDKSPRSASARAKTDVVVRGIDEKEFLAHIKRSPDIAINMMHRLSGYVRTSLKIMEGSVFDDEAEIPGQDRGENALPGTALGRSMNWDTDADHIINEFQSPEVAIEKRPAAPIVAGSMLAVVLLFAAFGTWATVSVIDTTISARGRLTTVVPTISVQAAVDSVVKTVHASVGQRVKKGDTLVSLDQTYAEADASRAEIEFSQLKARTQRLEAEMNREGAAIAAKIESPIEQKIFLYRLKEFGSKIASHNLDIKSRDQKLDTTIGDIDLARQQLENQRQLEATRNRLFEKQVGSKLNFLQARNTRLSTERDFRALKNSVANLRSEIEAGRARKQAFISGWFSQIGVELSQAIKERDAKMEELVKLHRRLENTRILAPVDGVILSLEDLFDGAIVGKGGTVMALVPTDVPLTVDIDVNPRDIGNLIMGAEVSLKLDALPYQKYGEIQGEIAFISEDTVDESLAGKSGTFYRARATILSNDLRDLPNKFRLVPGMLLSADIKTGRRRLITYFIYPIIRTIQTSFSEPGR